MPFELPADDEHTTIVGRNGSGKTQLGAWLLSKQNLRNKPWVIIDYKGDELLNSIDGLIEVGFGDTPDKAGLHILRSHPAMDDQTDGFLQKIWETGDIGVYVDEGYMLPTYRGSPYESLLIQGRSLRIPVITLSQRPVKVSRSAFSEASHIVVFHLNDNRDVKIVEELVPPDFMEWIPDDFVPYNKDGRLPPYHSRWYALKKDERYLLRPVPDGNTILSEINAQLVTPPPPTWRERLKEWTG